MAQKTDKQKAKELVAEVARLYDEAKTSQTEKAWAENTLSKMDEAIKLDKNNAEAWFFRGLANSELSNHQSAIDDYSKAIEIDSQRSAFWNARGVAKSALGDYQGAIDDYSKAIKVDQNNDNLWSNRGRARIKISDYQGTISDCTRAIEIEPRNASAWSSRGIAKNLLGEHKSAIDDCTKAIEIDPKNADAWSNRGFAKNALGEYQDAINDYTKAIELDPKDDTTWSNRGSAKVNSDDYQGAIDDCTKAIELNPKNDSAWNNRGGAKNDLGDHKDAINDCTKAIEINPKNDAAWHNRGVAKFRLGQYDDAIKDFDEALALNPTSTHTQQYRQGAEIAKLREEAGQNAIENRNKSTEALNKELKLLRSSLLFYRRARIVLFLALFYIIFTHLWAFDILLFGRDIPSFIALPDEDSNSLNIFLSALSRFSILSLVIFPIIWGIRLLNTAIIRNEILKWDIFSRMNIANSIDYYQRELGDKRNDIIIAYMEGWINKNPADKLITLHSKNPEPTEQSSHETLLRTIKNLLEQLTKRDPKGD